MDGMWWVVGGCRAFRGVALTCVLGLDGLSQEGGTVLQGGGEGGGGVSQLCERKGAGHLCCGRHSAMHHRVMRELIVQ
jgi:hypothetical protein